MTTDTTDTAGSFPNPMRLSPGVWRFALVTRTLGVAFVLFSVTIDRPWIWWLGAFVWILVLLTFRLWRSAFIERTNTVFALREDVPDCDGELTLPQVTVISPARNEGSRIAEAVRSLGSLDYPRLEVLLIDDHSTDDTGAIMDRLAAEFPRLRVIHEPPFQAGWQGKSNAVLQGARMASLESDWLMLTDSDVVFHPKALWRAVSHAEKEGLDFFTCVPYQANGSLGEEVVMTLKWSLFIAGIPKNYSNPKARPVGVGPFMLVRRKVYFDSGGPPLMGKEPEDTMLAASIKHWGGKLGVGWTPGMLRWRQYDGMRQIVRTWVRKMRTYYDDPLIYPLAEVMLNLLYLVLPLLLAIVAVVELIYGRRVTFGAVAYIGGGLAIYAMVARHLARARVISHIRRGAPWLNPFAGLVMIWIFANVFVQTLLRAPMAWRGRAYIPGNNPSGDATSGTVSTTQST